MFILNILLMIIICFLYDLCKSFILTRKVKKTLKFNTDESTEKVWKDFWDGKIPISSDFDDKGDN